MEGKIAAVTWCRTTRKPFLGICLGLQAAVIEFTRYVEEIPFLKNIMVQHIASLEM